MKESWAVYCVMHGGCSRYTSLPRRARFCSFAAKVIGRCAGFVALDKRCVRAAILRPTTFEHEHEHRFAEHERGDGTAPSISLLAVYNNIHSTVRLSGRGGIQKNEYRRMCCGLKFFCIHSPVLTPAPARARARARVCSGLRSQFAHPDLLRQGHPIDCSIVFV